MTWRQPEEHSTILMEKIKLGQIKAVISEVTESEIMKARKEIRDFYTSLPKGSIEFVEITILDYKTKRLQSKQNTKWIKTI